MNAIIGLPFVSHVDQNLRPQIENPKEFLKKAYARFFTNNNNLLHFGVYRLMGYSYNFKPLLKKYIFSNITDTTLYGNMSISDLKTMLTTGIQNNFAKIKIINLDITTSPDTNSVNISINYSFLGTLSTVNITI
jgi:hypothetical protein